MFNNKKQLFRIAFIAAASFLFFSFLTPDRAEQTSKAVPISQFLKAIDEGSLAEVVVGNGKVFAKSQSNEIIASAFPESFGSELMNKLIASEIQFAFHDSSEPTGWAKFFMVIGGILSWLPLIFIAFLMFGFFRRGDSNKSGGKGGGFFGGSLLQMNKSKAQQIMPEDIKVRFSDVCGVDEAKEEVAEIVDFLKNPQYYNKIGGVVPKGCLMVGSPGTGKTMLAKAIAGEANVPFFFISGSDFVEMFVGVGAGRVRSLFEQAKKSTPCIIFIDEIDAVGRQRGSGMGGGNDEREQTLNQLLVEMDGFNDNSGVIVIAATNRADVLDKALLRPGRFDRQINVPLPDSKGREEILNVHAKKITISSEVDLSVVARGTPGFSGAELANLVNEAALTATKHRKNKVTPVEFEEARDKILMGVKRRSRMKNMERELTAYHEGGHALVAIKLRHSDPVHKATIIPRGRALGVVIRLPKDDKFSMTLAEMKANIAVAMAGRAAEMLIFGADSITSGASSDIQSATSIAHSMVTKWGFSSKVGFVYHSDEYPVGESSRKIIDEEVKLLVDEGHEAAVKILTEDRKSLEIIAKNLLERETLTGAELDMLLEGKELPQVTEEQLKQQEETVKSRFSSKSTDEDSSLKSDNNSDSSSTDSDN